MSKCNDCYRMAVYCPDCGGQSERRIIDDMKRRIREARRAFYAAKLVARAGTTDAEALERFTALLDLRKPEEAMSKEAIERVERFLGTLRNEGELAADIREVLHLARAERRRYTSDEASALAEQLESIGIVEWTDEDGCPWARCRKCGRTAGSRDAIKHTASCELRAALTPRRKRAAPRRGKR